MTRTRIGLVLALLALAALLPWAGWGENGPATSKAWAQGAAMAPTSAANYGGATIAQPPVATTPAAGAAYSPSTYRAATYPSRNPGWMNPKSYMGLIDGGTDIEAFPTEQLKTDVDRWLDVRTRELAKKLVAVVDDSTKSAEVKEDLNKAIQAHFDVRHEVRQREIKELEERVEKLREHLDKRTEARDAIVAARLQQFVTTAEGLGWDDPPKTPSRPQRSAYGTSRYPTSTPSNSYAPAYTPTSPRSSGSSGYSTTPKSRAVNVPSRPSPAAGITPVTPATPSRTRPSRAGTRAGGMILATPPSSNDTAPKSAVGAGTPTIPPSPSSATPGGDSTTVGPPDTASSDEETLSTETPDGFGGGAADPFGE